MIKHALFAICIVIVLAGAQIAVAQQEITTVTLPAVSIAAGESATLEVEIDCKAAGGCSAFDIHVTFDPAIIQVGAVEVGPYLGDNIFIASNEVDNGQGTLWLATTVMGDMPTVITSNILFTVEVTALVPGDSRLFVTHLDMANAVGTPAQAEAIDGIVFVTEADATGSTAGKIAFVAERDGNPEIYVMDADGTDARRLTNDAGQDLGPKWSPDGTQIAFASDRNGNFDIYLMTATGGNLRRLTQTLTHESEPAWSPDGSYIVFSLYQPGFEWDIYVVDVANGGTRRLTTHPTSETAPVWSPDGSQIAFASNHEGDTEIYTMQADGSNLRRLTNSPGVDAYPDWSPDGTQIVFYSERDGNRDIYAIDANGFNERRLTDSVAEDVTPQWSRDGSLIVFSRADQPGQGEIYVMGADGSNARNLSNAVANDYAPDWQPDPSQPVEVAVLPTIAPQPSSTPRPTFTPQPAATNTPRPTSTPRPCTVSTSDPYVAVRLGPGENRGERFSLPVDTSFSVLEWSESSDGKLWWRLNIPGYTDSGTWVLASKVNESGDCDKSVISEVGAVGVTPAAPGMPAPTIASSGGTEGSSGGSSGGTGGCTVTGQFAATWQAHPSLGCPVNNAHSTSGAYQRFSGGHMVWRGDTGQIYVLYGSGGYGVYADLWSGGSLPCNPPGVVRGFGYLWCTNSSVSSRVGSGSGSEQVASGFVVQDFANGTIMYLGQMGTVIAGSGGWSY